MEKQKTFDSQTAKFLSRVAENMRQMTADVMRWWIQHPKELQGALSGLAYPKRYVYRFTVDYDLSLESMINLGSYDWVEGLITAGVFEVFGKGKESLLAELVKFEDNISFCNLDRFMDEMGFRHATLAEILAFGAKYPKAQRQFSVAALGSRRNIHDGFEMPCLSQRDSERTLDLFYCVDDWLASSTFLAIRK
ncbi:MAG: hypothetical protein WCO84_00235 [bacterium]